MALLRSGELHAARTSSKGSTGRLGSLLHGGNFGELLQARAIRRLARRCVWSKTMRWLSIITVMLAGAACRPDLIWTVAARQVPPRRRKLSAARLP